MTTRCERRRSYRYFRDGRSKQVESTEGKQAQSCNLSLCQTMVFASLLLWSGQEENSISQVAALVFTASPWPAASAAGTSTAAAPVCAQSAAGISAAVSAAGMSTKDTCLRPAESFFTAAQQMQSGYLTAFVFSSYAAGVPTRPGSSMCSRECLSRKAPSPYMRQQTSLFFAWGTAESSLKEKTDQCKAKGRQGVLPLEQEAAATPAGATKARDYSWGTRKSSYSRVRLVEGCGRVSINGRDGGEYLQDNPWWIHNCIAPLMELNLQRKYDVIAQVHGGGLGGQSGAIMLAVAREIVRQNPETKTPLRRAGFLTVDARRVERKKFGLRKARKREQYSKR